MARLQGFPFFPCQFDKQGNLFSQDELQDILDAAEQQGLSDLVFIAHGWNNDIENATALYSELLGNIEQVLAGRQGEDSSGRKLGFVGIFWPSKRFTQSELQPGGGASLDGGISDVMLLDELDTLLDISDADNAASLIEEARSLVNELEDRKSAQDRFVEIVREVLADDEADQEVDNERPAGVDTLQGREIIDLLSRPGLNEMQRVSAGAAALSGLFNGLRGGIMNFLNLTTYWKMKKRAGKVGMNGLFQVLTQLKEQTPDLAVHLVGHSFGARLVTASARAPDGLPGVPVQTLVLLQAAFSHFGFAEAFNDEREDGFFRRVISEHHVNGPVLVTHTRNDTSVSRYYPLASRLNRDDAAGLGDANDRFGGLGSNGAQKTPEAVFETMQAADGDYRFSPGTVHNLNADDFIADHGDVRNPAVANLVVKGITAI